MTAKRVAEWALEQSQTQALIGNSIQATAVCCHALNLIATYGNNIPDVAIDAARGAK